MCFSSLSLFPFLESPRQSKNRINKEENHPGSTFRLFQPLLQKPISSNQLLLNLQTMAGSVTHGLLFAENLSYFSESF